MVTVRRCHTAELTPADLTEIRRLCDVSFRHFCDTDWSHALGGTHVLVHDDGRLIAHGCLVLRRVAVDAEWLRCGYVEAVVVAADARRQGHASAVLASLEELAGGYDLLALSASRAGMPLYEALGWQLWRGPSAALTADGVVPTPDDDGSLFVRGEGLDVDAPLTCDWREGEPW